MDPCADETRPLGVAAVTVEEAVLSRRRQMVPRRAIRDRDLSCPIRRMPCASKPQKKEQGKGTRGVSLAKKDIVSTWRKWLLTRTSSIESLAFSTSPVAA